MRAEAAGDPGPWRQQAILGRGRWEADALRDIVRDYALETLADPDAVLVVDETGFLKQGKASCGVGRQYTGSAGKITNCRIGVFAAYASRHGHAFIDRALYLPKAWTDDPARLAAAHVPPEVGFATKPRWPAHGRARDRGRGAVRWVAGDSVYGVGEIETALRRAGKGYVLGVNATQPSTPGSASQGRRHRRADRAGSRTRCLAAPVRGRGHEGAAAVRLGLPRAGRPGRGRVPGRRDRRLDARPADPARSRRRRCAYFTTWCPAGTTVETLVAVEGRRWAIEDGFETAKNELGLDHDETRSWHGWHRHVSLVMLAFAMLAAIRRRANAPPPPKTLINLTRTRRLTRTGRASSAGRSRRSGASPCASRSDASGQPASSPGRSGDARTKPRRDAHT
jgi:SRSO17 transposase